jgi:hypothetical protein
MAVSGLRQKTDVKEGVLVACEDGRGKLVIGLTLTRTSADSTVVVAVVSDTKQIAVWRLPVADLLSRQASSEDARLREFKNSKGGRKAVASAPALATAGVSARAVSGNGPFGGSAGFTGRQRASRMTGGQARANKH